MCSPGWRTSTVRVWGIETDGLALHEARAPEHAADRIDGMPGVDRAPGYLAQHGREQGEVVGVDQRDLGAVLRAQQAFQAQRGVQAAKAAAQDQHAAADPAVVTWGLVA